RLTMMGADGRESAPLVERMSNTFLNGIEINRINSGRYGCYLSSPELPGRPESGVVRADSAVGWPVRSGLGGAAGEQLPVAGGEGDRAERRHIDRHHRLPAHDAGGPVPLPDRGEQDLGRAAAEPRDGDGDLERVAVPDRLDELGLDLDGGESDPLAVE